MRTGLKIGFIGGGMMAGAIVAGLTRQQVLPPGQIYVSDHKEERCAELLEQYGIHASVSADFISEMDVLVLAVKPQAAAAALDEVRGALGRGTLFISIVAGLTLAALAEKLPEQPLVRVMPNTPLAVGAGMSAWARGSQVSEEQAALVQEIFSASGEALEVKEALLDAVTGLSGSGPAYGFLVIDALADGGVAAGLPRAAAIRLAAQTMLGAAQMVLATGEHPDVLRDQVTSPAGTTIAGVRVLEQQGLRGALMDAVIKASERSRELGQK